jgi:hypothetical protein
MRGKAVDQISGLWDTVALAVEGFQTWNPPTRLLPLVAIVSMLTAFLLSRALGGAKLLTGPISFIVLFFCAMVTNYIGRDVHFVGFTDQQEFIAYAIAGQALGAVILLFAFKVGEGGRA